jgi:hypothetical protein
MLIYVDENYLCHTEAAPGRREFEEDFFDGKSKVFIEGYRYIPDGESWTSQSGVIFNGFMIAPAIDYDKLMVNVAISCLDDADAEAVTTLFPEWESGETYAVGDRRQYNDLLYRCVQAHTAQPDWTPDVTPALWVRTSTEEWPEWIQPTGAHDAYNAGDKVSHNGAHWISDIDANVYEPGVYGWHEAVEGGESA